MTDYVYLDEPDSPLNPPDGMRYLADVPTSPPPEGTCVVHNNVRAVYPLGRNGFRAWTQALTPRLEACPCAWAPLLARHYRIRLGTTG